MKKIVFCIFPLLILCGCAINQHIVPLASNIYIQKIYIERNFDARFDPALALIEKKLEEKGIEYQIVNGSKLNDAEFHIDYGGEFTWDLKSYMSKFTINVYQNSRIIAGAEYNAKAGGFRLDKFAGIESKVNPILDECFSNL